MEPIPVTLLGSTGLTGSATLLSLLASRQPFRITTLTRSAPNAPPPANPSTEHTNRTFKDLFDAVKEQVSQTGSIYVSCLGTTRGAAGGFEKQKKIDLDLNRELLLKAKKDGAKMAILVSSGGANAKSWMGYAAMKGQLEDELRGMDFEKTIIFRPGLLLGARLPELSTQYIFRGLSILGLPMGRYSIDASDVGDCIAFYTVNPPQEKLVVVGNAEMIEAARKWREQNHA